MSRPVELGDLVATEDDISTRNVTYASSFENGIVSSATVLNSRIRRVASAQPHCLTERADDVASRILQNAQD